MFRRNVLIFHLGALGDFILTWPVALALARLYPQSRIFYVTHAGKGQLAERALRIDSTDIESGWHALFADRAELPPAAEKLLTTAHTVVSFLSNGDDTWADNVRRIAQGATLIPVKPATLAAPPAGEHASGFIQRQLHPWPAIATAVEQILKSIADRGVGGRATPDGSILIHPGSGAPFKCWPVERFIELAERLTAGGRDVKFVIGETELERWPRHTLDRLSRAARLEQPANLIGLWQLINPVSIFIGNDSGTSHLAGILGVPTITLFGATSPQVWKPLGPRVTALHADTLDQISVDEVLAAISPVPPVLRARGPG
jgi:ADP-heptose:LPS heptosyltransferase